MKSPNPDNGLRERLAEVANGRTGRGAPKWLALQLGVHESTVCTWVTGRRTPSESMQARIAAALGLYPVHRWTRWAYPKGGA